MKTTGYCLLADGSGDDHRNSRWKTVHHLRLPSVWAYSDIEVERKMRNCRSPMSSTAHLQTSNTARLQMRLERERWPRRREQRLAQTKRFEDLVC